MNAELARRGLRHARMPIDSAVLIMHGDEVWSSDLEDISATGVLVRKPNGWNGAPGSLYVLDMIIGAELNIHVEARVARITPDHVGFAYARIPADKEIPLWNLLGGYADQLESFAL